MELLEKEDYNRLDEPLCQVTINNLFARSVVEKKVTGKVFVDDKSNPKTFYVVHPYGMTLLFGNSSNRSFNESFRQFALNNNNTRKKVEWMQAFPASWDSVLSQLFKGFMVKSADTRKKFDNKFVELNTRVNFQFNMDSYLLLPKQNHDPDIAIVQVDRQMFRDMKGLVVPSNFWDSEEDFLKNGLGYALIYKGELASMSFSSYWFDDQFELGIETKENFRGRGFAELVCRAIIDHCIKNNYNPIWSCRLENIGSYKLAQKLAFEPTITLPYYKLGY